MKKCVKWLLLLAILYMLLIFASLIIPNALLFHPPKNPYQLDDITALIPTQGSNKIAILFYAPSAPDQPTILYSHGNAENLYMTIDFAKKLNIYGYGVCCYDYPGYGLSTGKANQDNCYNAIETVYDYLLDQQKIDPKNIISYGYSLGGAMATYIASEKPIGGLILQSTFLSAFQVVTRLRILPFDLFTNYDKIKKVNCPVLIMHGKEDTIIPFWHAKKLYELANEPKQSYWFEASGHNDLINNNKKEYYKTLSSFITKLAIKN